MDKGDEIPRSRFGWLGKLNWCLGFLGLVLVWTADVDDGRVVKSRGYKLMRMSQYTELLLAATDEVMEGTSCTTPYSNCRAGATD